MADRGNRRRPAASIPSATALGFLVSGGIAFAVDALVLQLLTAGLGVHPIAARLVAISLAMIAGWLMHRTFTFAVTTPPSVAEFLRYAGVAWTAAAINYGVFVLIALGAPGHGAAGRARRLLGRGHGIRLSRHALCRLPAARRRGVMRARDR